jgi:hypothetical protein
MTAVRRRLVFVLMLAALFGATVIPAGAASPTIPANRPTPLPGATNGEVPRSKLVNVIPNCIAAREAAPSLMRLFTLARQSGVPLGAEECYRTLANEVKYANIANQPGNNPACVASVGTSPSGKPVGHSMHGWGKAVDLADFGGSLTFRSSGYAFMKRYAPSVGWNHPAFAEPGGSSCPEPWHWEWVGDGGNLHLSPVRGDAVGVLPSADDRGFGVVSGLGDVTPHGSFHTHGSYAKANLKWVLVGATTTPNRRGYWMVAADGAVSSFGAAKFHGSLRGKHLSAQINGMASSHSGRGYYLVAWDGGIFTFGDAKFRGSTGAMHLNKPVVGMSVTPSGRGYWLVASDGGIFTFGDAKFRGSTGSLRLVAPIIGMAPTRSGHGYWLVAADGGVFTFGDAHYYGSLGGQAIASPVIGLVPTKTGNGYRIALANGTVSAFGDARSK